MKKLGEILEARRQELKLTYDEVGKRAEITGVYVSGICRGKRFPSDEVALGLAQALELDEPSLIELARFEKATDRVKAIYRAGETNEGLMVEKTTNWLEAYNKLTNVKRFDNIQPSSLGHAQRIPVAGWVHAGKFASTEGVEVAGVGTEEWVYSDIKGRNLFALRVENDSMEPLFHAGDYLIVNPNLKPTTGDYVIAKLPSEGKATFKKLVEREGIIILRPLNPSYEDIVLTPEDEFEIIGKVVERKTIF